MFKYLLSLFRKNKQKKPAKAKFRTGYDRYKDSNYVRPAEYAEHEILRQRYRLLRDQMHAVDGKPLTAREKSVILGDDVPVDANQWQLKLGSKKPSEYTPSEDYNRVVSHETPTRRDDDDAYRRREDDVPFLDISNNLSSYFDSNSSPDTSTNSSPDFGGGSGDGGGASGSWD